MRLPLVPCALSRRVFLVVLGLVVCSCALRAAAPVSPRLRELPVKDGERVLFIGNSLTGRTINGAGGWTNNALASVGGPQIVVHRVQIWAQPLEAHWNVSREGTPKRFDKDGKIKGDNTLLGQGLYAAPELSGKGYITALEAIKHGTPDGKRWDWVVLQDYQEDEPDNRIEIDAQGRATYHGGFFDYGSRYIKEARAVGAEPVLFMRWLRNPKHHTAGLEDWRAAYRRLIDNTWTLARHHQVAVVPIGEIALELTERPPVAGLESDWLYGDGIHGNPLGVGLCGYTFAAVLGQRSPLPMQLSFEKYKVGQTAEKNSPPLTGELDRALKEAADRGTAKLRPTAP